MRKTPSLLFCFVAPVIALWIGIGIVGIIGYQKVPEFLKEIGGGAFAEGFTLTLSESGKYLVWCENPKEESSIEVNKSTGLPTGGRVFVFDAGSSAKLPLLQLLKFERKIGGVKSHSIGVFETSRPNQEILVKGTGVPAALSGSITPDNSAELVRLMLSLLAIVLFTFAVAIGLFIFLLHRRQKMLQAEG